MPVGYLVDRLGSRRMLVAGLIVAGLAYLGVGLAPSYPALLLAMGFVGPEKEGLLTDLEVKLTERGNVARGGDFDTSVPGVFVAGDMGRGQSLIVWAIAEGRAAAAGVDRYLMGATALPAPIKPSAVPLQ